MHRRWPVASNLKGVVKMRAFLISMSLVTVLCVASVVFAVSAHASQNFVYLVGSITDFNNLATTDKNKFFHKTDYGPYYFSSASNCEDAKTALEGSRPSVIPSAQKDNVIGNDLSKLVRVSTLQCLPITQ